MALSFFSPSLFSGAGSTAKPPRAPPMQSAKGLLRGSPCPRKTPGRAGARAGEALVMGARARVLQAS
eukprot:9297086-Alexandrium_andersonii.AAC.1